MYVTSTPEGCLVAYSQALLAKDLESYGIIVTIQCGFKKIRIWKWLQIKEICISCVTDSIPEFLVHREVNTFIILL